MENESWMEENLGLDEVADRTVEGDESSMYAITVPHLKGLPEIVRAKYDDIHVSFSEQTYFGVSKVSKLLVEIPRSEWMSPETYRSWLAAGSPKQIHMEEE